MRQVNTHSKLNRVHDTLDLMVLQTLGAMGTLHGYGIARRIEQLSADEVLLNQGAIYASLVRLQHRGWISAAWGVSDHSRKAKFYAITRAGKRRMKVNKSQGGPAKCYALTDRYRRGRCQHHGSQSALTVAVAVSFSALTVGSGTGNEPALDTDAHSVSLSSFNTQVVPRQIGRQCERQDTVVDRHEAHLIRASHVRALDRELALALADGIERSVTIHELVTSIDRSDVTAYLVRGRCPYPGEACLSLMSGRSSMRYLRINVQLPGEHKYAVVWRRADLVSVIAHELQHVTEIADDASVVDGESLRRHYQAHGLDRGYERLDSMAASETASKAKREFLTSASSPEGSGPPRSASCQLQ